MSLPYVIYRQSIDLIDIGIPDDRGRRQGRIDQHAAACGIGIKPPTQFDPLCPSKDKLGMFGVDAYQQGLISAIVAIALRTADIRGAAHE